MEEIRASESAATTPSIIASTCPSDYIHNDDADVGGKDDREDDVDPKVSFAGADAAMDIDFAGDRSDVVDFPSRVSVEEYEVKRLVGNNGGIREEDVELPVSISGSDVRDEDSEGEGEDRSMSQYDTVLTKFDHYDSISVSGSSGASTFGYKVGDLIWGKVKSHPWWPGHILNEAFAFSSIRRTHKEGQILVAFYGDSSYGWFDPAELVPFEENFAEKSTQSSAKSFVKAVQEAVDEVSRRRALGISCRCRNPQNFRPANEEGYFAVDHTNYDHAAVYPQPLIDKARDRFQPLETIKFLYQLAKRPLNFDLKSLDLCENKAVAMQLRRSIFQEFDDTYSEAFDYPPERPIRTPKNLGDNSLRVQGQAQLSGPVEAMRGKKTPIKTLKVRDKLKKDKYLLKRRDESDGSKESPFGDRQLKSSTPLSYVKEESKVASGDYVLQRRSPATSAKINLLPVENVESSGQTTFKNESENDTLSEMKASGPLLEATKGNTSFLSKAEQAMDLKHSESVQVVEYVEDVYGTKKNSRMVEESHTIQFVDSSSHAKTKAVGSNKKLLMKKPKTPKRSIGEVDSGMTIPEEKKMKKKIKKLKMKGHLDKSIPIAGPVTFLENGKDKERTSTILHGTDMNLPLCISANTDIELGDVLSDLKIYALDPFHAAEKNSLVMAKQMILKFRSLVFQKSLVLSTVEEPDSVNAEIRKSAIVGPIPNPVHNANTKDKLIKKPVRPLNRLDDRTKGGRKRPLSDRQEEKAMKKSKKITDVKSLANEKKASRKFPEPDQKEKEKSILGQPKVSKYLPPPKRVQPLPKVPEPTMLVLKFPQGTALPTVAALKARFARFGPLDVDSLRVFWQSSTCRVVFRYKADARKAYGYAVSNTSVFGNGNIRCSLREVGVSEPETKEETKDEAYPELPRYNPPLPPSSQLKSILKKSSDDETRQASAPNRANLRVKFILDGEEGSRGEQAPMMSSRNFVNGNNIASTSVAMDYNSRNMQKFIQSTSPLTPTSNMPVQQPFTLSASQIVHHEHNSYGGGMMTAGRSTATGSVDISVQMISTLTRCNEVVTNIKAHLGYIPYHSL